MQLSLRRGAEKARMKTYAPAKARCDVHFLLACFFPLQISGVPDANIDSRCSAVRVAFLIFLFFFGFFSAFLRPFFLRDFMFAFFFCLRAF